LFLNIGIITINLVYCPKTGIVSCHGFRSEPFTTNVDLRRTLKYYTRDLCIKNEDIGTGTTNDFSLCYKCNENTSKNGSIKIPYSNVYLRRNLARVAKGKKRDIKRSDKDVVLDTSVLNKQIEVHNRLTAHIDHKNMQMQFRRGTEDVIIRKRRKLSEIKEFIHDVYKQEKCRIVLSCTNPAK
jgi:hypothetical protein